MSHRAIRIYTMQCIAVLSGLSMAADDRPQEMINLSFAIIEEFKHEKELFTQGLEFHQGYLYESSGLYGRSRIVKYDKEYKRITYSKRIAPRYFAEGISIVDGVIWLLTWRSGILLHYSADDFKTMRLVHAEKPIEYSGEGWGLTHNGEYFIRSDGSDTLYYHHSQSFKELKRLQVTMKGKSVDKINELEWVNMNNQEPLLFANRWGDNNIYIISPVTGEVKALLNLESLVQKQPSGGDVLNGIAWHKKRQTLWVTGKLWHSLYELKISHEPMNK